MKAHIGVDSETGIVHSLSTTAANVHDVTEAHGLLHGGETQVWCDAGSPQALGRGVEWQVAMRPGSRKLEPESAEALAERNWWSPFPESEAGVWLAGSPWLTHPSLPLFSVLST